MTTSYRSQRAEARHLRDPHSIANARPQTILGHQPNSRLKRRLNPIEHEFDVVKYKKARLTGIAVEIPARSSLHHRPSIDSVDAKTHAAARHPPNPTSHVAPPVATATANITKTTSSASNNTSNSLKQPAPAQTKNQKKVKNGLKHELTSLQSNPEGAKDQGRKLRSQEGTRFKSELSAYFPDYDEVIGNDPKEYHILNSDTPIIITEGDYSASKSKPASSSSSLPTNPTIRKEQPPGLDDTNNVRGYRDHLFTDLCDSQTIDFGFLEARYKGKSLDDPLPDSVFEPAHKKAERLERSIRNSEKGRAQHERDQVVRLLEGLQGHDWLRVMGVSGITETKKKTFEPARAHFIKGCQVILGKFRAWAAEEKRRKLEKERAAAAAEAEEQEREGSDAVQDDEDEAEEDAEEDGEDDGDGDGDGEGEQEEEVAEDEPGSEEVPDSEDENTAKELDEDATSEGDPPDYSDVDASIAKQLREEAIAAAQTKMKRSRAAAHSPVPEPEPPKEFTSFFRKKHEREAAMSKSRRKGRKSMAWGQAVPEVPEKDFELPDDYLDEDTLRTRARRVRREKRGKN